MCSDVGTFAAQKQNNGNILVQTPLRRVTIESRTIQKPSTVWFHRTKSSYYGISLVNYKSNELDLNLLCYTSYI